MKGALIVGINEYPDPAALNGCVNDATALATLLRNNGDGSTNFSVKLKVNVKTRAELRASIIKLFQSEVDTALFYFSGHGCLTDRGGFIVTPDFRNYDEGISMDEIINIVNQSTIKIKIVIIDCCHSGAFAAPVIIGSKACILGEGVTILTACGQSEQAMEGKNHGIFTALLLSALQGAAKDIAGNITPAGVYGFIDRALGFWQQRPQFKTNVNRFSVLRTVSPFAQAGQVLKKITEYFETPETIYPLNPAYEYTNVAVADPRLVSIFKVLQQLEKIGLIEPVDADHMYWAAQNSTSCRLTQLGKYYWKLIKEEKI
jgi:hypothetical protein